jgi:large subunit ribosomal protein L21
MHVEKKGVRMTIYAVMKTGGKEYRVAPGDVVRVEKLAAAPGATVEIREVSSIETGEGVTVGSPTVVDARVIAEVIGEGHGEKILIFKKKRREHYQMISGDLQSYTQLRIREIAVGENVYATKPPPPRISKPERKAVRPQAQKPLQPPIPTTPPALARIELVPAAAAMADAPVSTRVASEELVDTPPQAPIPSQDAVRPVRAVESPPSRVETETIARGFAERATRKPRHGIAALIAGLLVITAALLVWGSRQPGATAKVAVEVATVAAPTQAAQASVPPPAAKATPRRELAVKKTAAASAPSAPVQPPE